MILGYNFVEERLFAARDYTGLSKEDAEALRYYRNNLAEKIRAFRDSVVIKEGNDPGRRWQSVNVFEISKPHCEEDSEIVLDYFSDKRSKSGTASRIHHKKNARLYKNLGNSSERLHYDKLSRGAEIQARVLEDRARAEAVKEARKVAIL